jgi:hypothetical protein
MARMGQAYQRPVLDGHAKAGSRITEWTGHQATPCPALDPKGYILSANITRMRRKQLSLVSATGI